MRINKLLFPSLLVCTALALIWRGFPKNVSARPIPADPGFEMIDTYIESQMRRLNIPGLSLAIVEGDEIVHLRGFGKANSSGETPSPQTPYFIGSTTKSFTALAVMQLVEAKKIELDAPVQQYLPWFRVADPLASQQITVRHLLNQTSGLPLSVAWKQLADFDNQPGATERQVKSLSRVQLSHPAGTKFEYSNLNYNVLGLIIEAASGESYAEYIQNHIFNPLKMDHSYTSKADAKQNGLATGHLTWFGIPIPVPDLSIPVGSIPSGQLISSAEDMGHYLIAYLNNGRYEGEQIISPESISELHHPAIEASSAGYQMGSYGMGWYIDDKQPKIIHHTGMVPDFFTYMALLPDQKKGIVMLVNSNHFVNEPLLSEIGFGVSAMLAGSPLPSIQLGVVPWLIRALLLIPIFQITGVFATRRLTNRWRNNPKSQPSRKRVWGVHILPSIALNMIPIVSGILVLTSSVRGFLFLFLPDLSWLAVICGGFSLIWTFIRTRMIISVIRKI